MQHLNHHHSEKLQSPAPSVCKKLLTGQTTLTSGFAAPLGPKSARATEITRCICVFMPKDMRPFSIVENEGFRLLVNTLEPRYTIPSHAEVFKSAVSEWGLQKANRGITVVTDNARNMDVAVREAALAPHVRCFAHTLNLASQTGLSVPHVRRLLGRVRRIAAFFHRSSTATAALAAKQILLELPAHKLIIDVATCWNSSLDMIERYLEQQAVVTATLLSNDVRRNVRDIDTLDVLDIRDAEDIVRILKDPLKCLSHFCQYRSMTLPCTSASHQIFCPIKCSLESKVSCPIMLRITRHFVNCEAL